jgi:PAS domain S-box-containing protein
VSEASAASARDRLFELSTDLLLTAGFDGYVKVINPAAVTLMGYAVEEVLSRPLLSFLHPDDRAEAAKAILSLAQGGAPDRFEGRLLRADGACVTVVWKGVAEADTFYAVGRDVTIEREREEQLRQAQKMEAVGQLTGGIAHDFNNLLTGILGSLELIQTRIRQGRTGDIERFASAASTSAQRAAALTQRLLAFARRQPLNTRAVDASALVTSMEDLLRRTVGETIVLEMAFAADLWATECDPHQLESALLNLAINARDAMPGGGGLTVSTANAEVEDGGPAGDVRPGQYVRISVADTGCGMPPEVVQRAFDPFFTTKPIGQGTGLGLSMIYGFARQSEGYAIIDSEVGRGTTISLYLPRRLGAAPENVAGDAPAQAAHRAEPGEVVLVVDDEQAVRELVTTLLEERGYAVLGAADGPAAAALLEGEGRIDLLVTDVGLPGFDGWRLAALARARRPGLPVLFMTGYADNAPAVDGETDVAVITKPFTLEALASEVSAKLGRSGGYGGAG